MRKLTALALAIILLGGCTAMADHTEELGVRKVVNAAGTYTVIGATRMSPHTLQAMSEAAASYVKITDLQQAVHRKVAELTRNEAAYICNSCSVAIYLAAAAFIVGHRSMCQLETWSAKMPSSFSLST